MNNQPKQMIHELILENRSLYLRPEVFASLDTVSGGETNTLISDDNTFIAGQISRYSQVLQRAEALYRAVRFAGQINRYLSWLLNQPAHLMDASEIMPKQITSQHYSSLQTVPINLIIASERCSKDFDSAFHPLQDENHTRWTNIAALKLLGADLPPVDLIQVQDGYIVRDGLHRISVVSALGQENIAACVTILQSGLVALPQNADATGLPGPRKDSDMILELIGPTARQVVIEKNHENVSLRTP